MSGKKIDEAAAPQPLEAEVIPLDVFCERLSASDRRIELISAFHSASSRQGLQNATEADFSDAFAAFCNQPA